jgi:hypothetical protein
VILHTYTIFSLSLHLFRHNLRFPFRSLLAEIVAPRIALATPLYFSSSFGTALQALLNALYFDSLSPYSKKFRSTVGRSERERQEPHTSFVNLVS